MPSRRELQGSANDDKVNASSQSNNYDSIKVYDERQVMRKLDQCPATKMDCRYPDIIREAKG